MKKQAGQAKSGLLDLISTSPLIGRVDANGIHLTYQTSTRLRLHLPLPHPNVSPLEAGGARLIDHRHNPYRLLPPCIGLR
ncbi:hypothetical protein [Leptolinea tardivitalis]|uniref:Uncharacterized protein n=1 Tax=Leptolinea tardivitalis TaxID=229920 RepID=A0A0P6X6X5_9CHLR|nr:hypothetical protein [Leptolinea tardivitalis]KPL70699.1 hypothetical protein ADM99_16580 [Leptolinea tardivitalis]